MLGSRYWGIDAHTKIRVIGFSQKKQPLVYQKQSTKENPNMLEAVAVL